MIIDEETKDVSDLSATASPQGAAPLTPAAADPQDRGRRPAHRGGPPAPRR